VSQRAARSAAGSSRCGSFSSGFSRAWGVLAALVVLQPAAARASPPFELMGSALGSGGLNARSSGSDASSAYFNPARLARAKPGLQLGWFVLNDAIDLTMFARNGVDVPTTALDEFEGRFPPVPTTWLQNGCDPAMQGRCVTKLAPRPRQGAGSSGNTRVYQVFGLVSEVAKRWLTLGVYGMVPLDGFLQGQSFFVNEREQYFSNSLHPELYSDRLTAMALAFGASSQLLDWLAFGVGATLSLTNTADAGTYVGNSADIPDTLQLATKIDVTTGIAPNFGFMLTPLDGLDISLTAHTPQKMEIVTGFSTFLPNGDLQRADRTATLAWEPWKFGIGAQYDFVREPGQRFGAVAAATCALWSGYLNRQNERPQQGYGWSNTVGLSFGLRHVYDERLTSSLDASYEPSPVPAQTGRTNYVDNDRYSLAASVSYQYPIAEKAELKVGVQGQVHFLPERSQLKIDPTKPPYAGNSYSQLVQDEWLDGAVNNREEVIQESYGLQTNNPGWPGYSSKGTIVGGGLNVSLLY
jgi:long-chain fatty acid transport protein